MLKMILQKIFGDNISNVYRAHPLDMVYPVLLLGVGTITSYRDGWVIFGFTTFIIGVLLGITIILAINWEKVIDYWDTLDTFAKTMIRANNPELWEALGFTRPETEVMVIEKKDHGQGFFQLKNNIIPSGVISPAVLQTVANTILSGISFSENEIVKKRKLVGGTKFRKFQKICLEKGWAKYNNTKDNRQGTALTKKGVSVFYNLASESVKLQLREKGYNNASTEE